MLRYMVLYCPVKFTDLQQPEKQLYRWSLIEEKLELRFFCRLALLLFLPPGFVLLEVLYFREKDLGLFYLGFVEICNASKPC